MPGVKGNAMAAAGRYPSRQRAVKAYARGVASGRPGGESIRNTYSNPKLRELFDRGRSNELERRRSRP